MMSKGRCFAKVVYSFSSLDGDGLTTAHRSSTAAAGGPLERGNGPRPRPRCAAQRRRSIARCMRAFVWSMESLLVGFMNLTETIMPFAPAEQADMMTPFFSDAGGVMIEHEGLPKSFASSVWRIWKT